MWRSYRVTLQREKEMRAPTLIMFDMLNYFLHPCSLDFTKLERPFLDRKHNTHFIPSVYSIQNRLLKKSIIKAWKMFINHIK